MYFTYFTWYVSAKLTLLASEIRAFFLGTTDSAICLMKKTKLHIYILNLHFIYQYMNYYQASHLTTYMYIYRITAVLKVETGIITSNKSNRMSCDTSDNVCWGLQSWHYCFYQEHHSVLDVTLTNKFQYSLMPSISLWDQRSNCQNYW